MRKIVSLLLMLCLLFACGAALADEPVKVTILHSAGGNDSHIEPWREQVARFEASVDGAIDVETEEIPGVSVDVRTKYKMLNAANNLPTIVTDLGAEPAFADLLISNHRLLNLAPYILEDEALMSVLLDKSVAFNTEEDGAIYTFPSASTEYTGIYYNTELFAKAGIEKFPETWDEFWAACDALQAIGVAPVALHTTETGWCAMLIATAYAATQSEENLAFLNTYFPSDFDVPAMADIAMCLQKLFTYTTADAVGGTYSLASNNFCAGRAAMIANGPWMAESFYDTTYAPEGFHEKVAYATYPCGAMISNSGENRGYAISMDATEEEQMAAIEFIKFLYTREEIIANNLLLGSMSEKVPFTDEEKALLNPILQTYAEAVENVKVTLPRYQGKWDSVVQTEVIEQELPNLAMGNITPEEFVAKMTEGAQRYLAQTAG